MRTPHEADEKSKEQNLHPPETELLERVGFSPPLFALSLTSGRNNQVLRVVDSSENECVLKRYFHHVDDRRDRLHHEWQFLNFAHERTGGRVPRPLVCDEGLRVAVMEYIPGQTYREEPSDDEVREAIRLIEHLNQEHERSKADLPEASDACFTLVQHSELLKHRLGRLEAVTDPDLQHFLQDELLPAASIATRSVAALPPRAMESRRLISPSDFGFHNAIRRSNGEGPCFIDFEYAGWDSAEKLVSDFFSQPEVPIPLRFLNEFVDMTEPLLGSESHRSLVQSLPPLLALHALKWCSILLNGFLPAGSQRRAFAGETVSRGAELLKAEHYFEKVCLPRIQELS